MDTMGSGKWFSALDLESGYHQIDIEEKDKYKTDFITRDSLFEWNKMPFGLINAPYTFQRIMNFVSKGLLWKKVIVYLDDILVFPPNQETHINDLREVLETINSYNLKLNFKKCQFGVQTVEFLGLLVENG